MTHIDIYVCDICAQRYDSEANALACEARGLIGELPLSVGDIVLSRAGFGWYDGDVAWISNPDIVLKKGKTECPNGDGNCFSECCTYRFYYVVTHIDRDDRDPHRVRYHLVTAAMSSDYRRGWNYAEHHLSMHKVESRFLLSQRRRAPCCRNAQRTCCDRARRPKGRGTVTPAELLRRLAEALRAQGQPFVASVAGTLTEVVLDALRALAREPGGAEAIAEAVGLTAIVESEQSSGWRPLARADVFRARIVAVEKGPGT